MHLTWDVLNKAQHTFNKSFKLLLTGGQSFTATHIIRMVPKKRLVAFGLWQGKPAVAKLFFDLSRANRHMERDARGIKLLQKNKIPTPALYYEGGTQDKQIKVLIFERMMDSKNLNEIWQNKKSIQEILPLLKAIMIELAIQHMLGVRQSDLHFKNFLITENNIYTLDGAEVELLLQPLNIKLSIENIALFLSQLGVGVSEYQEELFKHYARARNWLLKKEDITSLFEAIKHWNKLRWNKQEKKIFRNSTNYAALQHKAYIGMYDREYISSALMEILQHPDQAFIHKTANFLKVGGSSTVVKITLDGRDFVVKRYNIKHFRHFLRRCLRPTRAVKSWRFAQKLILFSIPTAKPIAFLEERKFGLRGKSYFITEYISDVNAGDYFFKWHDQEDKVTRMTKLITELLNSINQLAVTHGDLKITNILIDQHEQPLVIDLDSAVEHATSFSLERTRKGEIERFLRNFHTQPTLHHQFKLALGE